MLALNDDNTKASIELRGTRPIAGGKIRDVYRHPADPDLLIKVVRQSTLDENYGSGRKWYKASRRRYGHYISYLRELREVLAVQALYGHHPNYLEKALGLVETDVGLGLVVEAVFARDGRYAPTLEELVREKKFDASMQASLDKFFDGILRSPVVIGDVNLRNIVYGVSRGEEERFVLIDGIGHKTLLPVEVLSRRINKISNRMKLRNVTNKLKEEMNVSASAQPVLKY